MAASNEIIDIEGDENNGQLHRGQLESDLTFRATYSWTLDRTAELEDLVTSVVAFTCGPMELKVVKALIHHNSLTEGELRTLLQLDMQTIRICIQNLQKKRWVKIRNPGDWNEGNVGMGHIYVDFSSIRDNVAYILSRIREQILLEEKNTLKGRLWIRMKVYLCCTNPVCTKEEVDILQIHQHYHSTSKDFKCSFCWSPMVVESEVHPSTMTVERFNDMFAHFYKLLRAVDAAQPHPSATSTFRTKNYENMDIRICLIKEEEMDPIITPKPPIPWFDTRYPLLSPFFNY